MKFREAVRKLRRSGWQKIRKSATSHSIWQRGKERLIISESDPLSYGAIKRIKQAINC